MAVIRSFKAVRPEEKVSHLVASVPYDVVNREEAAELAKGNPLSFLRVTRSEIELDAKTDPYSEQVYQKARDNWLRLRKEAPLVQDEKSHFYIYHLKWKDQEQSGIAATFSANDYDNDVIKKHEKTRKVKEDDRTNHITTTEAQTGAVFLTYKGVPEVNTVVEKTMKENDPLYDFTAQDGVRHTVWQVPDDFKDIIIFELDKVESLYIADGHHRAASASRSRNVKKENNVGHTGEEEYNFFMAVLFPAEQLKILPYNRVIFNFPKGLHKELFNKLKEYFVVEETDNPNPPEAKSFCMYYKKKWYLLKPNENVKEAESVGENLDVSILQNYVLTPLFGIEDPRTDNNIDFIGGIRGTDELEKLVNEGRASIAFSMYPVSVEDLINISDAGEIMPPKSTWFEPKLRDGLLVHAID